MPQLPRVAVLGSDLDGVSALVVLIDAGLDATGLGGPPPAGPAAAMLAEHGRAGRWLATGAGPAVVNTSPATPIPGPGPEREPTPAAAMEREPAPSLAPVSGRARAAGPPSPPAAGISAGATARATGAARFQISVGGEYYGGWDAVVLAGAAAAAAADLVAPGEPWYGGVFHPSDEGVYLVGAAPDDPASDRLPDADHRTTEPRTDQPRSGPSGAGHAGSEHAGERAGSGRAGSGRPWSRRPWPAGVRGGRVGWMLGRVGLARRRAGHEAGPAGPVAARIAWEQARWIGEYLRGRYLLPPRSAMLTGLGPRRRTTPGGGAQAYLTALERERHAGRARAAAAGYPLPVPGTEAFVAGA